MTQAVTTADLLARHAGVLLDVYGVLFDARGPLPGAAELLAELDRRGTPYRIVTNDASRSQATYSQRFARYGITVAPERFVTSGSLLPGYIRANKLVGARILVLGTADSVAFVREGGALALTLPATPPRRPADAPRAASHGRDDTEPLFNASLDRADDTEPLPSQIRPPARPATEPGANLFGSSKPPARPATEPGANLFGTSKPPPAPLDDVMSRADTGDVSEQALAAAEAARVTPTRVDDERAHAQTGDLTDHVRAIAAELAQTRDVTDQAARARTEAARAFDAKPTRDLTDQARRVIAAEKEIHAIASAFGDARMIRDGDEIDAVAICDDDGFDFLRGIELALSLIVRAVEAGRTPHLILPNPDLVYPKGGGELGFTAGAIAMLLEAALARRFPNKGLRFIHLGKPQPLLFATAAAQLGLAPDQLVMIGDQLETDIAGARAAGCKCALLAGVSKWEHARDHATVTPDYLLETL